MTLQKDIKGITVLAAPMIDPGAGRIEMTIPAGKTVAEIVAAALPDLAVRDRHHVRVTLVDDRGSIFVTEDKWARVRPRAGIHVVIRLVPGKNALRTVLSIVVAVAAIALGQWWAGTILGLQAGTAAYGLASGLFALGVTVIGNLLINALIPPAKPDNLSNENRYEISGFRNRMEPDGAVPLVLGSIRYAPPYACYSHTEIVGDWQYVRVAMTPGYGGVTISGIRLGDTDINEYDEVEVETRDGLAGDEPLTLITRQVIEESVGAELLMAYPRDDLGEIVSGSTPEEKRVVRTTGADASGASVILAWPAGLVSYDSSGGANAHTVQVKIEQRRVDAEDWTLVTTIAVTARRLEAFYRQHTWDFPTRGRRQVAVTMMTPETTSSQIQQRTSWAVLHTLRPEYPWNFPYPLAFVAARIKATHQLNGQIDNLNALMERAVLDHDHVTGTWVRRISSNPAALYRFVLQTDANPKRVSDAGIDLEALADWHEFCRLHGLKYDRVIEDKNVQLRDLLTEIAAAGRASPRHDGVKWSVTVDRTDKRVVDHFNPRNSYDFRVVRSYVTPPDGFRIQFLDATNDHKPAERIVPWPGKENAEMLLTEELVLPGKTDPAEVYREGRRKQYEAIYRPDVYTVSRDGPVQVAVRGDRVRLSADAISQVQVAGRVLRVAGRLIQLDEAVTMEAGKDYAVRFRTGLSDEDPVGISTVRRVVTRPGTHMVVVVEEDGIMPLPRGSSVNGKVYDGDLVHFGEAEIVDYDLIVTGVEAGDDMSSHYRLVDTAPIIDELMETLEIPAWSGRAGSEIEDTVSAPGMPRFTSIRSGISGTGEADRIDYIIEPGNGAVSAASYAIDHRLASDTVWQTTTIPVANGGGSLTYPAGSNVQMRAWAISAKGAPSPMTTVISLIVGSGDAAIPQALPADLITVGPILGGAVVQFAAGPDLVTVAVQLYRSTSPTLNRATDGTGSLIDVLPSRSYSTPLGDATRQSLLVGSAWTLDESWSVSDGIFSHTIGVADAISQPLTTTTGQYYRIAYRVSGCTAGTVTPRLTGGSIRLGVGTGDNGLHSDRIQAVTGNNTIEFLASEDFDGSIDQIVVFEETSTCLASGTHYVWLEPQNTDGVPGPLSGPFTVTVR